MLIALDGVCAENFLGTSTPVQERLGLNGMDIRDGYAEIY